MPDILHGPFVERQPQAKQRLRTPPPTARKGTLLPRPEARDRAGLEQMGLGKPKCFR